MSDLCRLIWCALIGLFRSRAALQAEILVLRHQLNVLRRKSPRRLAFSNVDRLVFAGLYRLAPGVLDDIPRNPPDAESAGTCAVDRLNFAGIGVLEPTRKSSIALPFLQNAFIDPSAKLANLVAQQVDSQGEALAGNLVKQAKDASTVSAEKTRQANEIRARGA
jgi:hypothetical protein